MKNKIIALILVCIMSVTALASCGAEKFNFAENSSDYAEVDLAGFMQAIAAIEIEDADFTTNEETRAEKVIYNILSSLTSAAVSNNDKLTEGTVDENDVLYFVYYCTYTDEESGKSYEFYRDQMKVSSITTSTTKANHVIELATVLGNEDAKFAKAIYEALIEKVGAGEDGKFELEIDELVYDTVSTSGTAVIEGDTIVISYTRVPVLGDDASEDDIANAKTETVLYKELVLDSTKYEAGSEEAVLVELLLGENMTTKIGNDVYRTDTTEAEEGEEATSTDVKTFELTIGENTYTYSEIGVEWKVLEDNGEYFTFTYTPYETTSQKLENNLLHAKDEEKLDIKGKELTYHFYPVSYVEVSDISSESIIKDIFGEEVDSDSIELFANEDYKNGEDTVVTLIETLAKIWEEDEELVKTLANAEGKTLETLANEVTAAKEALDDAKITDENYTELEQAVEDAEKAYEDALDYCIDEQIAKILAASNGEQTIGDIFLEEYKSDIYDSLKETYDNAIVDAVGDELWLLVEKYVVVKSYPDAMVEEFYNHIYEQHEYDFYSGTYSSTTGESNYSHYKGDLEAYLIEATDATNSDYKAAITAEAKAQLEPLLQIFALSSAIEGDSSIDITAIMKSYTEADKTAGAYKVYDHDHEDHDHEEEEESMQKAYENALTDAEHFLVDDEALKAYKKYIGKASYNAYIENYGETNIRAALQLNRLMYYLLSTNVSYDDEGNESVEYKTDADGNVVLDFRTISYSIKAETEEGDSDAE